MYEEEYILDAIVHLTNGYLSFVYADKFLRGTYEGRRRALCWWTVAYAVGQMVAARIFDVYFPTGQHFLQLVPYVVLPLFLQSTFISPPKNPRSPGRSRRRGSQ